MPGDMVLHARAIRKARCYGRSIIVYWVQFVRAYLHWFYFRIDRSCPWSIFFISSTDPTLDGSISEYTPIDASCPMLRCRPTAIYFHLRMFRRRVC